MSDDAAFVRAVEAEPQDDAPRLVYADWLDEHGRPHEASFLRAEAQLTRVAPESPEAPPLRHRLWQAWAAVDPRWLLTFTQPRLLRANPTPFPSAWKHFGLGTLRPTKLTYDTWPYNSIPPLPIDELRGEFQYLRAGPFRERPGDDEFEAMFRPGLEQTLADAARKGVRLPEAFVAFMGDTALLETHESATDCFFTVPDEYSPIRLHPSGEGWHVHFYCDSQSCLLWDLYVHADGGHCVIARWPDYFDPEEPDPDDDDPEDEPPNDGPKAWFVAPSFEAFVYRVWIENEVWNIEHADFLRTEGREPPALTPEIRAYIDHYRPPAL